MTELIPMKLKPCPFCYGQAELVTFEDRDSGNWFVEYFVQCSKCRASGPLGGQFRDGKLLAVKAWNRRARKPLDKPDIILDTAPTDPNNFTQRCDMQLQDAIRLTNEEFKKWGLNNWTLKFNNRLTRALGLCLFSKNTIELQSRFVKENPEHIVLDTIRHEVAHALAGHKAGHGYAWKMWAIKVGANPEATVDAGSITLTRKYQLAFVKDEDRVRKYERLDCFSDRKLTLKNKMLKGRPETLNCLVWLETK